MHVRSHQDDRHASTEPRAGARGRAAAARGAGGVPAASTEPRAGARGRPAHRCCTRPRRPSFNGAARRSARKGGSPPNWSPGLARFNGAARRSARKAIGTKGNWNDRDASTEPRAGARGRPAGRRRRPAPRPSFNGAARRSARKGETENRSFVPPGMLQRSRAPERAEGSCRCCWARCAPAGFNGAARRSARKGDPATGPWRCPSSLQRSRAPERAEGLNCDSTMQSSSTSLQRSRAPERAEGSAKPSAGCGTRSFNGAARRSARKGPGAAAASRPRVRASTEPRAGARGRRMPSRCPPVASLASTEPRAGARGRSWVSRGRPHGGPGFNGAARRSARKGRGREAVRLIVGEASTEPRAGARGRPLRCSALASSGTGFNGAARRSARKAPSHEGRLPGCVRFNGAARRSARKGRRCCRPGPPGSRLQRSRAPERAEGLASWSPPPASTWLQRSRAPERAEGAGVLRARITEFGLQRSRAPERAEGRLCSRTERNDARLQRSRAPERAEGPPPPDPTEPDDYCFNGAARRSARKVRSPKVGAGCSSCFNGAARRSARKAIRRCGCSVSRNSLQRSRAPERAEGGWFVAICRSRPWLQRSRAPERAEGTYGLLASNPFGLLQRSRAPERAEGKHLLVRRDAYEAWLQRSRAPERAEGQGRWFRKGGVRLASTEPRAGARGRGPHPAPDATGTSRPNCEQASKSAHHEDPTHHDFNTQPKLPQSLRATPGTSVPPDRSHTAAAYTGPLPPRRSYHEPPPRRRIRLTKNIDVRHHVYHRRAHIHEQHLIVAVVDHLRQLISHSHDLAAVEFAQEHAVLHMIPERLADLEHLRPPLVVGDVVRDEVVSAIRDPVHRVTIPVYEGTSPRSHLANKRTCTRTTDRHDSL